MTMDYYNFVSVVMLTICFNRANVIASDLSPCDYGYWGDDCKNICSVGCSSSRCDRQTGICFSCASSEYYGKYCDTPCYSKCRSCDRISSECSSCHVGWYGEMCEKTCPLNCSNCAKYTGACSSCTTGWHGASCDLPCPPECENNHCSKSSGVCNSCKLGWFGSKCEKRCNENCQYGCSISSGGCQYCIAGFWGSNCSNHCVDNCEICDKLNGECLFCSSGFSGNNCRNKCLSNNCKICRSTGECQVCTDGFWGTKCLNICNNCTDNKCEHFTGECTSCPLGFAGEICNTKCEIAGCLDWVCDRHQGFMCSSCQNGFWGTYCEKRCLQNERCRECDKSNGFCNTCATGYWGQSCEIECPVTCIWGCSKSKGFCDQICDDEPRCYIRRRCKFGFWGSKCENKCIGGNCEECSSSMSCSKCRAGFWGQECLDTCTIDKCLECDIKQGFCTLCEDGFWGRSCNLSCHSGCKCCDTISGLCERETCLMIMDTSSGHTNTDTSHRTLIAVVIALSVFTFMVLLVACLLTIWTRRNKKQQEPTTAQSYQNVEGQTMSYKVDRKRRGNDSVARGGLVTPNEASTGDYGGLNVNNSTEPAYEFLHGDHP